MHYYRLIESELLTQFAELHYNSKFYQENFIIVAIKFKNKSPTNEEERIIVQKREEVWNDVRLRENRTANSRLEDNLN